MKRVIATALVLLAAAFAACYQDDAVLQAPAIAPTKVFITDDPFPFDTVGSVNIYVTRIEASTGQDTTPDSTNQTGSWVTIATPNKSFDLLTLQQGTTAFVGQAAIDAGQYHAIRMTIDVDKSSIKYLDNTDAVVQWPYPYHGEVQLYAVVEGALDVSRTGTDIVIDFDLGRSFLYNYTGNHDFLMLDYKLRAVISAATGAITGKVVVANPPPGTIGPRFVENATITVFSGNASLPSATWNVISTGRTDVNGVYVVGFVPPGSWNMEFAKPEDPKIVSRILTDVVVTRGDTTQQSISLPYGGTALRVSGQTSVGVGGTLVLHATVGDSAGVPLANPQVSWFSRDTSIATVLLDSTLVADSLSNAIILGRAQGSVWIVAQSGTLKDSIAIQVTPGTPLVPVASITLVPASLTLVVGDTGVFEVELRDSLGNLLTNRQVSWFFTDSTGVATLYLATSAEGGVHAMHTGTTVLRAASEGKFKDGTVTVH